MSLCFTVDEASSGQSRIASERSGCLCFVRLWLRVWMENAEPCMRGNNN